MVNLEELLKILACPKCKGDLELSDGKKFYICRRCSLAYPIEDGIPIMLIDKALPLESLGGE